MDNRRWIAAILAIIGLFYVAAPHSLHVSSGLGFGWGHTMHIVFGFALFVIAGALYSMSGKRKVKSEKSATKPVRRKRRK